MPWDPETIEKQGPGPLKYGSVDQPPPKPVPSSLFKSIYGIDGASEPTPTSTTPEKDWQSKKPASAARAPKFPGTHRLGKNEIYLSLKQDAIQAELSAILNSFGYKGPRLVGKGKSIVPVGVSDQRLSVELTIEGHDYWWFLEFGTASHYRPKGEIELAPPPKVQGHAPGHAQKYDIAPIGSQIQERVFPKTGGSYLRKMKRRTKFLRFMGTHGYAGQVMLVKAVQHPGLKPHMQIRKSILTFQRVVAEGLSALQKQTTLPTRENFKTILNYAAMRLRLDVIKSTPISAPSEMYWKQGFDSRWQFRHGDPRHLVSVINVIRAK